MKNKATEAQIQNDRNRVNNSLEAPLKDLFIGNSDRIVSHGDLLKKKRWEVQANRKLFVIRLSRCHTNPKIHLWDSPTNLMATSRLESGVKLLETFFQRVVNNQMNLEDA